MYNISFTGSNYVIYLAGVMFGVYEGRKLPVLILGQDRRKLFIVKENNEDEMNKSLKYSINQVKNVYSVYD